MSRLRVDREREACSHRHTSSLKGTLDELIKGSTRPVPPVYILLTHSFKIGYGIGLIVATVPGEEVGSRALVLISKGVSMDHQIGMLNLLYPIGE